MKIDVEEMVNDALEVAKATGIPLEELIVNYPDWLKARITLAAFPPSSAEGGD